MPVTTTATQMQHRESGEIWMNNMAKERWERIRDVIRGNRTEVTEKRKLDFGDI